MSHTGQECAVVLEGVMHIAVGADEYRLEAGDSITYDSSLPHHIENRGSRTSSRSVRSLLRTSSSSGTGSWR